MPRYYFHCADGGLIEDHSGIELGDIQDARIEAVVSASDALRARPEIPWTGHDLRILTTDDAGKLLFVVKISVEEAAR